MRWCMRTNIVLDDELVAEARKYARVKTKTGIVEEALRAFVELHGAARRRASYERRVSALRSRVEGRRFGESATAIVRRDRERG